MLPSCSSQFTLMQMWDHPVRQQLPYLPGPPGAALLQFLSTWLPISGPPTSLNECVFFNSLVVGLPNSFIFCQFWLFFVFKFVVVLLLLVRGGKVYLPTPPSWLEVGLLTYKFWEDTIQSIVILYFVSLIYLLIPVPTLNLLLTISLQ